MDVMFQSPAIALGFIKNASKMLCTSTETMVTLTASKCYYKQGKIIFKY